MKTVADVFDEYMNDKGSESPEIEKRLNVIEEYTASTLMLEPTAHERINELIVAAMARQEQEAFISGFHAAAVYLIKAM